MRELHSYTIDGETLAVAIPRRRRSLPEGWTDTSIGPSKTDLRRRHVSGWEVRHCGHPTANWPYAAYHDDGRALVSGNGRGWIALADAMAEVERAAKQEPRHG